MRAASFGAGLSGKGSTMWTKLRSAMLTRRPLRLPLVILILIAVGLFVLGGWVGAAVRGLLRPSTPPPSIQYVYRDRPPPPPDTTRVYVPQKITVYRKGDTIRDTVYVPVEWTDVQRGLIPLKGTMPLIDIDRRSVELAYSVGGQVRVATYRIQGPRRWSVQGGVFASPQEGLEPGLYLGYRAWRFRASAMLTPRHQVAGLTVGF